MPYYRRVWLPGGTYFFTVNLLRRRDNDLLIRHIDLLRSSVAKVKASYPFKIHAWVVLPEHLHCILEFPEDDCDFPVRWRLIKSYFSKSLPKGEFLSGVRRRRGERGIWQRRYWEHVIRNDEDYRRHMDYIHYNPMKHHLVSAISDWPYSTFHRSVELGLYPVDWCGRDIELPCVGE